MPGAGFVSQVVCWGSFKWHDRIGEIVMTDPATKIENLRERIDDEAGDEICEADADQLLAFSDELFLLQSQYSDTRHVKLLGHCVRAAEAVGGLAGALEDRDPAEALIRWINRNYDNEEYNRDYRVALRMFGQHTTDGDDVPESLDWIPATTSSTYDPSPDPRDMLHWDEHILPMLEACYNARDRAMVALQWDAGLRSGEFKDLQVGDITDHDHGLQVTVAGKQGKRSVSLIPSVPYVSRWLDDHPTGGRDDPLWCGLHAPHERVSDTMMLKVLKESADRAGVDRPVTPTNLRKSSASYLASEGMSQSHLEEHHGWVRGSDSASRYVAVFGAAADNELARIHGRDVSETESDPVGPIQCPRCDRDTPREKDFCVWCQQALSAEATSRVDEARDTTVDALAASDDPDKRKLFAEFLSFLDDRPDAVPPE